MTFIRLACARRASAAPISPKPAMPRVFSAKSLPNGAGPRIQAPERPQSSATRSTAALKPAPARSLSPQRHRSTRRARSKMGFRGGCTPQRRLFRSRPRRARSTRNFGARRRALRRPGTIHRSTSPRPRASDRDLRLGRLLRRKPSPRGRYSLRRPRPYRSCASFLFSTRLSCSAVKTARRRDCK